MVKYVETESQSTNVSFPVPSPFDHMQVTRPSAAVVASPAVPFLSTLVEHPEFQEGLRDGQQTFQEGMFWEDHEKAWTEDDIIELVTGEVSEKKYRREQCMNQVMGYPSVSYLHYLGFAIGYLDQALATRTH